MRDCDRQIDGWTVTETSSITRTEPAMLLSCKNKIIQQTISHYNTERIIYIYPYVLEFWLKIPLSLEHSVCTNEQTRQTI